MDIGQQIRKYRERDEYSQEYLAEKLYVSRQTISNWENEKSYPDIHNLLVMCELFDISLDDLVRGDLNSNKHKKLSFSVSITNKSGLNFGWILEDLNSNNRLFSG